MAKRRTRVGVSLSLRQSTLERLGETLPDEESTSSWADQLINEALDARMRDRLELPPSADPLADPLNLEAK